MAGGLAGKVTLVTGGASGIGRATALAFAKEGAPIVIADVDGAGGEETGHLITTMGGEARFIRADVSQAADVEALIGKAVQAYGRLDCAFNNAGIYSPMVLHKCPSCMAQRRCRDDNVHLRAYHPQTAATTSGSPRSKFTSGPRLAKHTKEDHGRLRQSSS